MDRFFKLAVAVVFSFVTGCPSAVSAAFEWDDNPLVTHADSLHRPRTTGKALDPTDWADGGGTVNQVAPPSPWTVFSTINVYQATNSLLSGSGSIGAQGMNDLGIPFEVDSTVSGATFPLKSIQLYISQQQVGLDLKVYLYQGHGQWPGNYPKTYAGYWLPNYGTPALATFDLVDTWFLQTQDQDYHYVNFATTTPYALQANTPYVLDFRLIPNNGQGFYSMAKINNVGGYTTGLTSPTTVDMPDFELVAASYGGNLFWKAASQGNRFISASFEPVPEPEAWGLALGGVALALVVLERRRRRG
jgi:hypothetical protein